jgi:uncharacterized repeat protein (TIGR04138 family)
MPQTHRSFSELLRTDKRYKREAYQFVTEALNFAQQELGMGSPPQYDPHQGSYEPHLTGQQLCEAVRIYSLEQFGYMAKVVLNTWGIYSTSDVGEVVYNLIDIGKMKKSKRDRREDFDNVYEFDDVLRKGFRITVSDSV